MISNVFYLELIELKVLSYGTVLKLHSSLNGESILLSSYENSIHFSWPSLSNGSPCRSCSVFCNCTGQGAQCPMQQCIAWRRLQRGAPLHLFRFDRQRSPLPPGSRLSGFFSWRCTVLIKPHISASYKYQRPRAWQQNPYGAHHTSTQPYPDHTTAQ